MTKTPMEGTAFCKIMNCNTVLATEKEIQHYSLVKSILNFLCSKRELLGCIIHMPPKLLKKRLQLKNS